MKKGLGQLAAILPLVGLDRPAEQLPFGLATEVKLLSLFGAPRPEFADEDNSIWDHKNFLVVVAAGKSGTDTSLWSIRIVASEVLEGRRDFGLVVSGGGLTVR